MTAPVPPGRVQAPPLTAGEWLDRLDQAHAAASPWAARRVHEALPALTSALRAVLALADEDDARRGDYGYRIRNGLDPSPGDRIRSAVTAALGVETTEAGQ
jgi:hypothetical protein